MEIFFAVITFNYFKFLNMGKSLFFIIFLTLATFATAQSDLFISEMVEGSGNNKAIEIFNPTNTSIDLSAYFIARYANGATTYVSGGMTQLSGTIQPNSTFVLINGQTVSTSTSPACDPMLQGILLSQGGTVNGMLDGLYPSPTYFNGNDAIALLKQVGNNKVQIDLFGQTGLLSLIENEYGWSNVQNSLVNYQVTVVEGTDTSFVDVQSTIADYIVKSTDDSGQYYGPYWMCWTRDFSIVRKSYINQGVTTNPSPFIVSSQWKKLSDNVDDWSNLGIHSIEIPYSVFFNVSDGTTPISDAIITLDGITNEAGNYTFNNIVAGTYNYSVYKYGFINYSGTITIFSSDVNIDVVLNQSPAYIVEFNITDGTNPIPDAIITFNGSTNSPGDYTFSNIFPGSFSFTVVKNGYKTFAGSLTVSNANVTTNVIMEIITYSVTFNISDGVDVINDAAIFFNEVLYSPGDYFIDSIIPGVYSYSIVRNNYGTVSGDVNIVDHDTIIDIIMTDIDNIGFSEISIFPNPVEDELNLNGISGSIIYQIFNLNGVKIQDGIITDKMEVEYLKPGLYILKLYEKNIMFLKK